MDINVPLLRKAVEWVEEQDQLPPARRQWRQTSWVMTEETRIMWGEGATGCGTAYCVAGWVAAQAVPELAETSSAVVGGVELFTADVAGELLGLEPVMSACACPGCVADGPAMDNHPLFNGRNSARDIRRIAEELAGERL